MLIGQTIMVLDTIMKNPGLNTVQLAQKIEEIYGKEDMRVRFMFLEEIENNSHFKSLFDRLYCVEEKDGCYFYNDKLPLTDEDDIIQTYLKRYLEHVTKKQVT